MRHLQKQLAVSEGLMVKASPEQPAAWQTELVSGDGDFLLCPTLVHEFLRPV
jgi:hypothetical protein